MNAVVAAGFAERLARIADGFAALPDKPEETPDSTLRALWLTAAGTPMSAAAAVDARLPALNAAGEEALDALLERRQRGEPLAHLTGRQRFMGLEFACGPAALVPRAETELLAGAAIALARELRSGGATCAIAVDACTGCGNVPLALAHHVDGVQVHAADLSIEAVDLARANAARLGLADRVRFRCGDLLAPLADAGLRGAVDLLTCNPPYISSSKVPQMAAEIASHEPRLAFDGGPLGIGLVMRLLQDAPALLRVGGWLAFEVGLGQGPALARRLRASQDWGEVREIVDAHGATRVLLARRA